MQLKLISSEYMVRNYYAARGKIINLHPLDNEFMP